LNYDLDDLQHNYKFSSKCINSVPQAIYCFLVSDSFEDTIRKSISIGGDTDTIACIAGSISEAFYGIDEKIKKEAYEFIPKYMIDIVDKFYDTIKKRDGYGKRIRRNN
jgi:ADP-ribosylglycohydrolase